MKGAIDSAMFSDYLDLRNDLKTRGGTSAVWRWDACSEAADALTGRHIPGLGAIALKCSDAAQPFDIFPGVNAAIQAQAAGASTDMHQHAWWHFFVVLEGAAKLQLTDPDETLSLGQNDIAFVAASRPHQITAVGPATLKLLNLSNMAEQAMLSGV